MSEIDEYIAANRGRYTREAITERLVAAGHAPEAIDEAWRRSDPEPASEARGWRPGWRTFLLLMVIGAVGAVLVWADQPYGAGGIALVVYVILGSVAFGLAKLVSALADGSSPIVAGVLLALVAIGGGLLAFQSALPAVALLIALAAGIPALALLTRADDRRVTGAVAAAVPLLVWVGITGTCYAPLIDRVVNG